MTMKSDKHVALQLMKAAVPAESYMLSITFNHLYSLAMSTANNQVGAALFPSF